MTIADIFREAQSAGIRLWLKDGALAVTARETPPAGLIDRIRAEKPAIVAWLSQIAEDAAAQSDRIVLRAGRQIDRSLPDYAELDHLMS